MNTNVMGLQKTDLEARLWKILKCNENMESNLILKKQ